MKGRVLSITNHKGGVGKTTTAVNVAHAFVETGKEVLVIDLDPQGSATLHLGIKDDGSGLLYAMGNGVALPVLPTPIEGLSLVPSGPVFAEARQRFSGVLATELLSRHGYRTEVREILAVRLEDRAGSFLAVLDALAKAKVNVQSVVILVAREGNQPLVALSTSDAARARAVLKKTGFASLAAERLVSNDELLASAPSIPSESVGLLL